MRILLTGGTGFVGARLARRLHADGHALHALVRAGSPRQRLADLTPRWVTSDLLDTEALQRDCAEVDAVVHAAGLTSARRDADYLRVNAGGTESVARAAAAAGVARFVLVGSLAARGPDARSTAGDAPDGAYGASKLEAERRLATVAGAMRCTVLRPAGVYGPGDTDLLPLFVAARRGLLPLPPARQRIQPLYVDDLAARVGEVVTAATPPAGPLALAEPRAYGWAEAAALLGEAVARRPWTLHLPAAAFRVAAATAEAWAGLRGEVPALDRRRARDLAEHTYTLDPAEARAAWGGVAPSALREGLAATAAWYLREGWL